MKSPFKEMKEEVSKMIVIGFLWLIISYIIICGLFYVLHLCGIDLSDY